MLCPARSRTQAWMVLQLCLRKGKSHCAVPCLQLDAAWMAAKGGVTTVIASGKGADALLQVVAGELGLQWLHALQTGQTMSHMHPAPSGVVSVLYLRPSTVVPQAMTPRPLQWAPHAMTLAHPPRRPATLSPSPHAAPTALDVTPVANLFHMMSSLSWVI